MLVDGQRKSKSREDQSGEGLGAPGRKVIASWWEELEVALFWRVSVPIPDKENIEQFKLMCIY